MAVRSINGKNSTVANSPFSASGVIVPRVLIFDASSIYMNGRSGKTLSQALLDFAPMDVEKISGTADDYLFNVGGFSD